MKQRALELKEQTIGHRRKIHEYAEVGLELPKTMAYIKKELKNIGISSSKCGHGIMAEIGAGERCILLRADADALPNGHTCGHDCHAAMLLTAAKMLKEREEELGGRVRLMFQPAEETLQGARDMIQNGILGPRPQAALAFHTAAGKLPPGMALYGIGRPMMQSADNFTVTFCGQGGHSAYANKTIDPIQMAVEAYGLLPEVSFGVFQAGAAGNVIPDTAVLKGSLRTETGREQLLEKLKSTVENVASRHGGTVKIDYTSGTPALICDEPLTLQMADYLKELGLTLHDGVHAKASEDFAYVAQEIPSAYFYLTAGFDDDRGEHLAHDPEVQIHEDVLPIGAAAYAHCAYRFLKK